MPGSPGGELRPLSQGHSHFLSSSTRPLQHLQDVAPWKSSPKDPADHGNAAALVLSYRQGFLTLWEDSPTAQNHSQPLLSAGGAKPRGEEQGGVFQKRWGNQ